LFAVSFLNICSFLFQPLRSVSGRTATALGLAALLTSPAWSAPFEDTIAQRTQACTACHGAQGRAAPDGYYPRLAGKPATYIYNQLLHFREGRRHYGLMTQMVEPLTDAYLMEISQYFADLKVPYPPPQPTTASAALLEQGRQLVMNGDPSRQVTACVQCHGMAMTGVLPNVPGLLGLPRDYLNAQLGAWKNGKRQAHAPDCMAYGVERLSLADINAASTWLAAQAVPANSAPALSAPNLRNNLAVPTCGSVALPQPTRGAL
jgi:cytochrome c553